MKTIYVDNSVFGGKIDPEFELWTDLFKKNLIRIYCHFCWHSFKENIRGNRKSTKE